jgi:hypothetical protein
MAKKRKPRWKEPETAEAKVLRENVVAIAKKYAEAKGRTLALVSVEVYGNRHLLPALEKDHKHGSVTILILGLMLAYFRKNWPENVDWPFLPPVRFERQP